MAVFAQMEETGHSPLASPDFQGITLNSADTTVMEEQLLFVVLLFCFIGSLVSSE